MKIIIRMGRILGIVLFVSGVVLYLLFASFHPLLHNHHADGKHHPDCPACNFLLTAAFSDIPEIVVFPAISYHAVFVMLPYYHQPYQQLFYYSHSNRGPPVNFV